MTDPVKTRLTESARLGDRAGRRVLSVAGTESNDGSVETSSSNSEGAMRDELIDKDDTVDTLDGVLVSILARGKSVGSSDGEATLGSNDMVDCVGVSSSDADDDSDMGDDGLTSVIGVSIDSSDDSGVPLGRKNDVSKDVSGPSASAIDAIDGDARSIDDS